MDVFICWSGDASRILAEGLRTFLRRVIQAVDPFMSSEDIGKGQRWSEELSGTLAKANFGILCMTPENVSEPWIQFEAGALSKDLSAAGVSALLLDIGIADLSSPIRQFQHTRLERDDVGKLLAAINKKLSRPLDADVLEAQLQAHWPDFEKVMTSARAALKQRPQPAPKKRTTEDMFEQILEALNSLQRQVQPPLQFSDPTHYLMSNTEFAQRLKQLNTGSGLAGLANLSGIANVGVSPGAGGITLSPHSAVSAAASPADPVARPK